MSGTSLVPRLLQGSKVFPSHAKSKARVAVIHD